MKLKEYIIKPNATIPTLIMMLFFVIISVLFAINGNWMVLFFCVIMIFVILPEEIRLLKEKIIVCESCIILQNVICVRSNKKESIDRVEIKWCDVKNVKFDTSIQSSFMRITTKESKFKCSRIYIKSLENYPCEKKMKIIIHQYWNRNNNQ